MSVCVQQGLAHACMHAAGSRGAIAWLDDVVYTDNESTTKTNTTDSNFLAFLQLP